MVMKHGILIATLLLNISQAAQTCNLVLNNCPSAYTTAITVPQNIIWLDPKIPFCTENIQVQAGTNAAVPSIVFIIDNSGSMTNTDPQNARFSVTKTLLDSIYKVQPATKVGIVVFSRRLSFDFRDNSFFKTAFPNDTSQHDSFIPLTALNQTFSNNGTGIATLKEFLRLNEDQKSLFYATKQLADRSTGANATDTRGGTDITLGFDAAKVALIGDNTVKENQYFIFLSDGKPQGLDPSRTAREMVWVKGDSTPTTFTVFFGNEKVALDSLAKMNKNIQNNGYSTGNPRSRQWAINLPASELLSLLQTNVLNPIFANTPGQAKSATLLAGGVTYSNTTLDAKSFVFPKRIPLAPDQTSIQLNYVYTYTESGKTLEKTVPYTLNIKRSGNGALASGLASACQDQTNIGLAYNGSPISRVTADHEVLEAQITLQPGTTCTDCKVSVAPNKSADQETLSLTPGGGIQRGSFNRVTSTDFVTGDKTLQHVVTDSIVLVWVNPENPLDIVRKAFHYTDIGTALTFFDHNTVAKADGTAPSLPGEHFTLVAPLSIHAIPGTEGPKNWDILSGPLSRQDSVKYVGITVEASRAFKLLIRIYTNHGHYVNKIEFSLTQPEFEKLDKGIKNKTRMLRVLWDNRDENGNLVGTGAYIMRTDVTLLRVPGIAEDQVLKSEFRKVGVLRSQ